MYFAFNYLFFTIHKALFPSFYQKITQSFNLYVLAVSGLCCARPLTSLSAVLMFLSCFLAVD